MLPPAPSLTLSLRPFRYDCSQASLIQQFDASPEPVGYSCIHWTARDYVLCIRIANDRTVGG